MDESWRERQGGRGGRAGLGCVAGLATLALGGLLGAMLAAGLIGVDLGYLFARATGSAPPLVAATPVPTPVAAVQGAAAPGSRMVWRAPIALDSDTREPDLLVISRNYDRGGDSLLYLSPDERQVRWESAPLGDNGNSWLVAFDRDMVYVADEARLLGLGRGDGALRWEAPLSDKIFYNVCIDCLQVVDGVVLALSDDGVLQAFRGSSGAPLWSHRLREATRQLVVAGGLVAVPDRREGAEDSSAGLYFFNPADGSPARAAEPSCDRSDNGWTDRPHYYDPILVAPDGGLFWLMDSARCVVRVGGSAMQKDTATVLPEDFSLASSSQTLYAEGSLYISDGRQVAVVDAGGEARLILSAEDYELRPLDARGGTLLLEATRRRGSSRLELWAVDLSSGERRWERALSGDDPIEGFLDSGDWAAAIVGDAVALVEQLEEPPELRYELIALSDGASRASATLPVEDPDSFLRGGLFGNRTLFLAIDELYAVDLASGETQFRWPAP